MSLRLLLSNNEDKLKRIFPGMRSEWILLLIKGINDIETKNDHSTFNNVVGALMSDPPQTFLLDNMIEARCGTFGCVYYNAQYNIPGKKRSVAVKTFKNESNAKELFIEVLIQIILSVNNKDNPYLKVPEPIFFGKWGEKWVFVMERINNAVMFTDLIKAANSNDMYAYILRLCNGLFKIQQKFNFMHRDLHSDNILFDKKNNGLYIIDFGYSCIGVRDNDRLYSFTYGKNYGHKLGLPVDDLRNVTCNNDSHDICTCLLSLYYMVSTKRPKLKKLCAEICTAYRRQRPVLRDTSTDRNLVDNRQTVFMYNSFSNPVFHFWYLYKLTDIRTKYTPKYLSSIKCLNPLKKYFEKLKF